MSGRTPEGRKQKQEQEQGQEQVQEQVQEQEQGEYHSHAQPCAASISPAAFLPVQPAEHCEPAPSCVGSVMNLA